VIESDCEPDVNASCGRYRCHREFTELIEWLRAHGVTSRAPIHALRKEYGSWVNQHFGLVAASEALRHSNISTQPLRGKQTTVGLGVWPPAREE
jgi:hypothetical protein